MLRLLAALPLVAPGSGGATLLADINQEDPPNIPASFPQDLAGIGGKAYFSAHGDGGREPWVSDGTTAGTVRLADAFVGFGSSSPAGFTGGLPSGEVLFTAGSQAQGREPWVTDGTPTGTRLLADLRPGQQGSNPSAFTAFEGRVYFVANDGTNGRELWSTDGTAAGTQLEVAFQPGVAGIESAVGSARLAVSGGTLYVSALDANGAGWSLWKSDGSAAGTEPIRRITNDGSQPVSQMVDLDGLLMLRAPENILDEAIWRSDGTVAGTFELVSGSQNFGFDNRLQVVGDRVFFAADDGVNGRELWKSDGTLAGTEMVVDLQSGSAFFMSSDPRPLGDLGGVLIFSAFTLEHGQELWTSDGTAAGTVQIEIFPGSGGIQPGSAVISAGKLVFSATHPTLGNELFASDGTVAGTGPIADIAPGVSSSTPNGLVDLGGLVLFAATEPSLGSELWSSDGVSGANLVADISPVLFNQASDPAELTPLGTRAFFSATDGVHGRELWGTDGTAAGTELAIDLNPGEIGSQPVSLTALGDRLFFLGNDGVSGLEPWITDGTPAGTLQLADVAPGPADSNWSAVSTVIFEERLFFTAIGGAGDGIWSTDGTPAGTVEIDIPGVTLQPFFQTELVVLDGALYFVGFDLTTGFELYRSDGTSTGTNLVVDLNPGSPSGVGLGDLAAFGEHLYFVGDDGASGTELWRTDGTAAGTELVEDFAAGSASSSPAELTPVGDVLAFTRLDASFVRQVWATDGASPAEQLAALPNGLSGPLFSDGARGFFWSSQLPNPQLWSTDGTPAGTEVILDVQQAQGFFGTPSFGVAGTGPVSVLAADDGTSGFEVFRSDGTAAGTSLVADVESGASTSRPSGFVRLGNRVLFVAEQFAVGRELHSVSLVDVGDYVQAPFGNACAGSSGETPTLLASGPASAGTPLSIELANGAPSSPAFLLLGLAPLANPLGACLLDVAAPVVTVIATDATGSMGLGVTPGAPLVGVELFLEALVVDPGAEFLGLASKTRALELIVGP